MRHAYKMLGYLLLYLLEDETGEVKGEGQNMGMENGSDYGYSGVFTEELHIWIMCRVVARQLEDEPVKLARGISIELGSTVY